MAVSATSPAEQAARTCAYLIEISPEMRGCAIFTGSGELLAAGDDDRRPRTRSGGAADDDGWEHAAGELIAAADAAGDEPASHAHVSTGDGEVFMVRAEGLIAIAVAERLTLHSLVLFDLRTALRDLASGRGPR